MNTTRAPIYYDIGISYNVLRSGNVSTSYVRKVSSNGQVSIPAEARARWHADRVVVVNLGDRIVVRPLPPNPVAQLLGKYQGQGPTRARARRDARTADDANPQQR